MITTMSETHFKSLKSSPELQTLADFSLHLTGSNGSSIPYSGYCLVEVTVPELEIEAVTVPVLVVPSTRYSATVPVIVGTNVLNYVKKSLGKNTELPGPWNNVLSMFTDTRVIPVKVFHQRAIIVKPYETRSITGMVRNVGDMSVGITEATESSDSLVICPRVVQVKSGNTFSRIPVRICNMSASPMTIKPRSLLCGLQEVDVVRSVDPGEGSIPKQHNSDKSLSELSIDIPTDTLSSSDHSRAISFLNDWKHIFSAGFTDLGCTRLVEHKIELSDPTPFKEPYRRIPPGMFEEVREHLKEMLEAGAIRESHSPFSSNVVLVRKKGDNSLRFCIDFRRLNNRTVKDAHSLPRIEETIDTLAGSRYFSKLDLRSGYWQVAMKEEDKAKTAFSVGPLGFYECNRLAFGLCNAPGTFQRLMERCMGELHLRECVIYLDDIIIFSKTLEEHFSRLRAVFERLESAGLKLKGSKCEFFRTQVTYLGHLVSERGVETDPEKISALQNWPAPSSIKELRRFLGFASYFRRFVPRFAQVSKPLNDLLVGHPTNKKGKSRKSAVPWVWAEDQQEAFDQLISLLTSPPVLAYADYDKPFILNCDASGTGLGAVLCQEIDGTERVVAYASRGLRRNERNYPAHKLEFLALKWAVVDKFHDYLYGGKRFKVRTDNNPLTYAFTTAKLDAVSHRWLAALATYDFSIHYRPGAQNQAADFFSRPEEVILFPETLKALFQAISVECEDAPAFECLSISQPVEICPDSSLGQSAETCPDSPLSQIDWRSEQEKDPSITRVSSLLRSGHRPTRRQASLEPESVRKLLREWDRFHLKDNILYRHGTVTGQPVDQLVLPDTYHELVFIGLHDDAGHQGRERTLALAKSRFYWPGMDFFIEKRVSECPRCILRKRKETRAAGLIPIQSTYPMELVCMDFLSLEMSSGGYENILVITDHFTRYSQAFPTRNQSANTTAKCLFEQFIVHYGFPTRLHSDRGRNFESSVIQELCKIANVEKSRTTPYHAQGNGQTERFNQTLLNMLGTLEESQKVNWKSHVSTLVHAYNATRHDSTGYTPYFLIFGRHPRLAVDAFLGIEPDQSFRAKDLNSYSSNLKKRLDFAYKVASKEAKRQGRRHKRQYDKKVRNVQVVPGDRVLVRNVGLKGKNKLADKWCKDVYIVVEQPIAGIPVYKVKKEFGKTLRTLHRNLLLPFMGLPLRNPIQKGNEVVDLVEHDVEDVAEATESEHVALTPESSGITDPLESMSIPGSVSLPEPVSERDSSVKEGPTSAGNAADEAGQVENPAPDKSVEESCLPSSSKNPRKQGKYIIPARRTEPLNPLADTFIPARPKRQRQKPYRFR